MPPSVCRERSGSQGGGRSLPEAPVPTCCARGSVPSPLLVVANPGGQASSWARTCASPGMPSRASGWKTHSLSLLALGSCVRRPVWWPLASRGAGVGHQPSQTVLCARLLDRGACCIPDAPGSLPPVPSCLVLVLGGVTAGHPLGRSRLTSLTALSHPRCLPQALPPSRHFVFGPGRSSLVFCLVLGACEARNGVAWTQFWGEGYR